MINDQPVYPPLLLAGRVELLKHQHSRNRIEVTGKMYHRGFVSTSGLTMEMPLKPTREIKAPRNSHFHAMPRPMSKRAPRTRGTTGKGSVLGLLLDTPSAMKKNRVSRMRRRPIMRATHRMTLIDPLPGDAVLSITFSLCCLTLSKEAHRP
jgi:hypothetical protein